MSPPDLVPEISRTKPVSHEAFADQLTDARLRALANAFPVAVWTASPDGKITFVSDHWVKYSRGEGDAVAGDSIHPEDRERALALWTNALRDGTPFDSVSRLRRHDGQYRWFLSRAVPVRDSGGRVESWIGTTSDIHEYRLAEEELKRSEERFHHATEAMAAFVYDTDLLTGRVECFTGPDGAFGYEPNDLPRDFGWWQSRVHPEDLPGVREAWAAALQGTRPNYTMEFRFQHRDGRYVDVLDRGHITRDGSGRAIRVVGGSTDVSERRRLERDRESLLAQLETERARLVEIFRVSPSFFALTRGPNHVYEYANEAYCRDIGHRDVIGRSVYDFCSEQQHEKFFDIRQRVLDTGIPFVGKEARLTRDPGDGGPAVERFLDVTFSPYTEPDGARTGIIVHGYDVTEHVRARQRVEQLLAERDELLTIISHDVRTPLMVMDAAMTSLLREDAPSAENVRRSADLVKRAVGWMARLLGDLVDVTSIEAGRLALVRVPDFPRVLVTEAAEMFADRASAAGIALDVSVAEGLPVVLADPARILQTLGNLILNAFKATAPGGRVTLRAEHDPVGVRFVVEDTGVGITTEDLPHMFDRAWQQSHRTGEGTGSGLAIVRGIVQAHGGQASVDSTLGEGTRFSFTMPASDR